MLEVIGWYFIILIVLIVAAYTTGYILCKVKSDWYYRICKEHYLNMVAEKAVKKHLEERNKREEGDKKP